MDADYASVARDSIAAALIGWKWIDEEKSDDEWEHRFYTAIDLLRSKDSNAWRTLQTTVNILAGNPDARPPSTEAYRRFKKKFKLILEEVGIDLFPF